MYDTIKKLIHVYYIIVPICAIVCIIGILCYASRTSNIDTTGIQNAQNELRHAREYNQQSIDYNQRARAAVESGQVLNERIESAVTRSVESNQRTEEAVDRGAELTAKARADAERAKSIISESRSILERAKERTGASEQRT